jgi:hypothetical protein
MQIRFLSLMILVSSLCPYLSWGKTNHTFLFQAEWSVLNKFLSTPSAVMHPLIIVPLMSQLLILIFGIICPKTSLVYLGILGLYPLIAFILFAGFLSGNIWMVLSCTPFIICSTLFILLAKKK